MPRPPATISQPQDPLPGTTPVLNSTAARASALDQMQRYSGIFAAIAGLVVLVLVGLKVLEYYHKRRHPQSNASSTADGQPRPVASGPGPVENGKPGFSAAQVAELGACWKHPHHGSGDGDGDDVSMMEAGWRGWASECVVCLGEYQEGELLRKLHRCGHVFHQECIDAWLATHQSCPFCRTALVDDPKDAAEQDPSSDNLSSAEEHVPSHVNAPQGPVSLGPEEGSSPGDSSPEGSSPGGSRSPESSDSGMGTTSAGVVGAGTGSGRSDQSRTLEDEDCITSDAGDAATLISSSPGNTTAGSCPEQHQSS